MREKYCGPRHLQNSLIFTTGARPKFQQVRVIINTTEKLKSPRANFTGLFRRAAAFYCHWLGWGLWGRPICPLIKTIPLSFRCCDHQLRLDM